MTRATRHILAAALLTAAFAASGEAPYAFRGRLAAVHRADRRDMSLKAGADEFEFRNGAQLFVPAGAPGLVRRAAEDFADYLIVSMAVNASVRAEGAEQRPGLQPGVSVAVRDLGRRGYDIEVGADGVKIDASDDRMAAQAFYHLEDAMNLRRGPFLKLGRESRSPVFAHRFTFAGFGNDIFPDAHLNQIAHHGFTGIEVWLDDYDVPSQGVRQDVNDLVDRAEKFGLSVHCQPRNRAYVHPSDPRAPAMYEAAYGNFTKYYPKVGSVFFCGEVCEFPSKDPRCNGGDHRHRRPEDAASGLPYPGWYPCSDWADWVRAVLPSFRSHNPNCRFVFSTYNWGCQDEKARADLIASLPKGITLIPTFEMFENHVKRNGLVSPVADYSLAFPGPGRYFRTEAAQAKAAGIELWSNCNSAGLTWDFGNIPYQPAPWQWKKRWDALKDAHERWNLTGLRENHEYGWYPSFVSELEKECMTDGGMDFDVHVRAVAARDFGEANADAAVEAWRRWSRAAADYVPTDENQYGPCRIGPAYPFNFFGEDLQKGWKPPVDFPLEPGAKFTICHFDFHRPIRGLGMAAVVLDEKKERQEIELFESQVADYRAGAETFRRIAASLPEGRRDEAVRMAALGDYLMRACATVVHLKRGRLAWRNGDRKTVEKLARAEYANAEGALRTVDSDSRLGWLASSGYTGGRAQIEWKLRKMRELYGDSVAGVAKTRKVDFAEGRWNRDEWVEVRHGGWDRGSPVRQMPDCIMNFSDDSWSDEELFKSHQKDVFSSLMTRQRFAAPAAVASTMSFDHRMAPALVIAGEIGKDGAGRPEFRDMYEIVLYDEGINVWRHHRPDGADKADITKVACLRRRYFPRHKYRLEAKVRPVRIYGSGLPAMEISVTCGDDTIVFQDSLAPDVFHVGVIGSEGRCRFYGFELPAEGAAMDKPAAAAGRGPNISVFASAIHKTAKQRGVSIAQAADMLYAAGVRGFDTSASDANLPALAATKLKPINLYCFPNMYAEDNGAAECARILDTAVKYGVPRVMVVPSSFRKDSDEEADFAMILSAMKTFVEKGRARGVTITVEDFGGTNNPCSYAKYLKRLMDGIPGLCFALDSGNLYYAGRGDDILDMMKYAKGRIAHVHLKDQTREDNHKYATIGLGAVPNAEIVRTVSADGYDGWYTLENPVGDVYEDVLRQIAVLKSWIAAGQR